MKQICGFGKKKRITIPVSGIKAMSLVSLAVPVFLFNLLFLKWYVGLISNVSLMFSVFIYCRRLLLKKGFPPDEKNGQEFSLSVCSLAVCVILALGWAWLSGIGGYFTQSPDFNNRNALFHDMLNHSWPVYFEGTDSALTYYIGYWIVPAIIGKAGGAVFGQSLSWPVANAALYLQTVWFLLLVFLQLLSVCKRRERVGRVLLVFIFFSGMDGMMCFLRNDWSPHIEWWAETWQYSSMTTSLFWVFNQAVPAWIVTLLFLQSVGETWAYALIGLVCTIYSPLPLAGLAVLCAGCFAISLIHQKEKGKEWKQVFSPVNICALIAMIPVFLYLTSNHAAGGDPFRLEFFRDRYPTASRYLFRFGLFLLIEWGFYAAVVFSRFKKDPLFLLTCISLAVIPLFKMGENYNDFVMRASVPGLVILGVYCIRFLLESPKRSHRFLSYVLTAALTIGALTAATEIKRGVDIYLANGFPEIEDDYGTVLNAERDTPYFLCTNVSESVFYQYFAKGK